MTIVRRRPRPALATLSLAAGFAFLTLIPLRPWQATCFEIPVPGPYRPVFIREVARWFAGNGVYNWRIGQTILVRVLPLFDGYDSITHGTIFLDLTKIEGWFQDDLVIDGVLFSKPPAVRQIESGPPGTYDLLDLCRAAIQWSPNDPPLP